VGLGLVLMGTASTFGQNILPTPVDHKVNLDKTLYEHGYNKDNASTSTSDSHEARDSVMVTSVMDYFVMPDEFYNKNYFGQNDYKATNLTNSRFNWTVTSGTSAPQSANATGTSPWIKVTWGATTGNVDLKMQEVPQISAGCAGAETTIPVTVIAKPTIKFNHATKTDTACYNSATIANAQYDFPVTVTTETTGNAKIEVDYDVEKTDLTTGAKTTTSMSGQSLAGGTLHLAFSDYGEYKVTIKKITDRIARKCDVVGIIDASNSEFTYHAFPEPQAGKAYHVPNNF
jgi:hypothetical protein